MEVRLGSGQASCWAQYEWIANNYMLGPFLVSRVSHSEHKSVALNLQTSDRIQIASPTDAVLQMHSSPTWSASLHLSLRETSRRGFPNKNDFISRRLISRGSRPPLLICSVGLQIGSICDCPVVWMLNVVFGPNLISQAILRNNLLDYKPFCGSFASLVMYLMRQ